MATIKRNARTPVGNKIAKGFTRDGNCREVKPVKENPGCPYTNPAKAKGLKIPQKQENKWLVRKEKEKRQDTNYECRYPKRY